MIFNIGFRMDIYWQQFVDDLMAQVKYYGYDVELHTKYRPKGIIEPKEAFAFEDALKLNMRNAFSLRNMYKRKY